MIRWRLRELMGKYQGKTGNRITYEEITEATGLSPNTLSKLSTNKASRTDLETIERLLVFFSENLDTQLSVNDLLDWTPDATIDHGDGTASVIQVKNTKVDA